jgi:hypothetical protein
MSAADKEFYNNVLALQDQASGNFESWIQSMDTTAALNQLVEFFAQNPSVSSATLGSQGIAVEYTNGMCGGFFLFPQDEPSGSMMKPGDFPKAPARVKSAKSLVNIKEAVLLNPTYWERSEYTDWIKQWYDNYLPKVFFNLQGVYKNEDASVGRFTKLAGHGLIHIYSHGWAWPEETNLRDVYLLTGEVANLTSTIDYWDDIRAKKVIISKAKNSTGWKNIYFINEEFIAAHNDFKKDTVLFYGGFCYSLWGKWAEMKDKFAQGAYFGFSWSVYTDKNASWAVDLVDYMSDTSAKPPYTAGMWFYGASSPRSYIDDKGREVRITFYGDSDLAFWHPPLADFSWASGSKQNPTEICAGSSVTVLDKSLDYGQPIEDWQWYFTNGQPVSFNGQQPPAIYFNTVGPGGIKLTIHNPFGTSTKEVTFSVVTCK